MGCGQVMAAVLDHNFVKKLRAFPMAQWVKNLLANAGNTGDDILIPGWGRSPAGGNVNPSQYSCLKNSMDRGAWCTTVHGLTKNHTQLK